MVRETSLEMRRCQEIGDPVSPRGGRKPNMKTRCEDRTEDARLLFLDLMKRCLARTLFPPPANSVPLKPGLRKYPLGWVVYSKVRPVLGWMGIELGGPSKKDLLEGRVWPSEAETMIGMARLENLQSCVVDVLQRGIPGDIIETGVWRGGACIFSRAILRAYGCTDKTVWVADSFEGLPKPDGRYPQDANDRHWRRSEVLGVPLEVVKANFERYGMLDAQVRFLKGWFHRTLPTAPIQRLSVMRLDGDMYASTMDALVHLYPKLSPGGFVIVDDYGAVAACRSAVEDYRHQQSIMEPLQKIDWTGVFWRKNETA